MRFEGISCDECREPIKGMPEFQVGMVFDKIGKVTSLEIAREIIAPRVDSSKGYALLDICGMACLQKSVMRSVEKIQLTSSNGKHVEAAESAGDNT